MHLNVLLSVIFLIALALTIPPGHGTTTTPQTSVTSGRSRGFWSIKLSPESIGSVPFGSGHIAIWEHANSPGRFYYMPLAYLLSESPKTQHNILTGMHEMIFEVLMWSLEAREAVYRHLKKDPDRADLTIDDVEMLPMEKIRLVWKGDRFQEGRGGEEGESAGYGNAFWLHDRWQSNTHLPAKARFTFACVTEATCLTLARAMRETPIMFHSLELEYVINGQSSARRRVSVTGQTLMGGQLMTQLENMSDADSGGERYVTSADLKAIVAESAVNVVASVTTDADYVDTGDEVSVKNLLERVLGRDEVAVEDFEPRMWSSVFWNPDWARPDKYATFLNKVLTKDESDSKNFILNEEAYSKSSNKGASGSFFKISLGSKKGEQSSRNTKVQKENLLKTLEERHSHVEWSGEVFRAKPLKLYRINLSELNSTATIAVVNMQIHKYELVERMAVRVQGIEEQTSELTSELIQTRLMDKLEEEIGQLNTKITSVQSDSQSEQTSLRQDLTKLQHQIQQTQANLDKSLSNVMRCNSKIWLKSWKGDYLHRPDSRKGVTSWHTGIGNLWSFVCQ